MAKAKTSRENASLYRDCKFFDAQQRQIYPVKLIAEIVCGDIYVLAHLWTGAAKLYILTTKNAYNGQSDDPRFTEVKCRIGLIFDHEFEHAIAQAVDLLEVFDDTGSREMLEICANMP